MEDAGQDMFRAVNGAIETSQEPFKPGGYGQSPHLLRRMRPLFTAGQTRVSQAAHDLKIAEKVVSRRLAEIREFAHA